VSVLSLAIVVVNYASHRLLAENLAEIDGSGTGARIVVVDNFSTETERDAVAKLCAEYGWDLVHLMANRGFGAAVNAGVAFAKGRGCSSVLILNPDAVVRTAVVAALAEHSQRDPMALVSPLVANSAGQIVFQGIQLDLHSGDMARRPRVADEDPEVRLDLDDAPHTFSWLTAVCLVTGLPMWERIGGFDESYFMYWEDVDLSYRARAAGGRLVVRTDLTVVHDEGGTQERTSRAKSSMYYRYNCRNRLVFAARHLGRWDLLRWLIRTPRSSWQILMRGGRRQLLQQPRTALAAAAGTISGFGHGLRALVSPRPPG
jgi:GT2 family glycosyltransferase